MSVSALREQRHWDNVAVGHMIDEAAKIDAQTARYATSLSCGGATPTSSPALSCPSLSILSSLLSLLIYTLSARTRGWLDMLMSPPTVGGRWSYQRSPNHGKEKNEEEKDLDKEGP